MSFYCFVMFVLLCFGLESFVCFLNLKEMDLANVVDVTLSHFLN